MSGEPAFFEIGVPDDHRARAFYGKHFNWTFSSFGEVQVSVETPTIRGGLHGHDTEARIVVYSSLTTSRRPSAAFVTSGAKWKIRSPKSPASGALPPAKTIRA